MNNKEKYIAICDSNPSIPVFAQYWWLNVVCPGWDVAIVYKGDRLAGTWAYPVEQKAGVTLIRTPFFTPYLGPFVFFPADIKDSNRDGYEYETIQELLKQIKKADVWSLAMPPGLQQAGLFRQNGMQQSVQQTFIFDLLNDEPALLANMKESLRKNIRQAEKDITITNEPGKTALLCEFYTQLLQRKGKQAYTPAHMLTTLVNESVAHSAGALWVASTGDVVHGVLWHVWDGRCGYNLCLAQNPASDNYKAMSLLIWHAIKASKTMGHISFDLEGSMDEGVERFYRTFGGIRTLYMILNKNESLLWRLKQLLRG